MGVFRVDVGEGELVPVRGHKFVCVKIWRWEVSIQAPVIRVDPALVPDPTRKGDYCTWAEARAKRAKK